MTAAVVGRLDQRSEGSDRPAGSLTAPGWSRGTVEISWPSSDEVSVRGWVYCKLSGGSSWVGWTTDGIRYVGTSAGCSTSQVIRSTAGTAFFVEGNGTRRWVRASQIGQVAPTTLTLTQVVEQVFPADVVETALAVTGGATPTTTADYPASGSGTAVVGLADILLVAGSLITAFATVALVIVTRRTRRENEQLEARLRQLEQQIAACEKDQSNSWGVSIFGRRRH